MALNVLNTWGEIFGIAGGALILIVFAVTFFPLSTRLRVPPNRVDDSVPSDAPSDEKKVGDEKEVEKIRAKDSIESFNGDVYGGRAPIPLVVAIFSIGLLIWWGIYLVTNWSQVLWSVRSFWR